MAPECFDHWATWAGPSVRHNGVKYITRYGGITNNDSTTNLQPSMTPKEFPKSASIWLVATLSTHGGK